MNILGIIGLNFGESIAFDSIGFGLAAMERLSLFIQINSHGSADACGGALHSPHHCFRCDYWLFYLFSYKSYRGLMHHFIWFSIKRINSSILSESSNFTWYSSLLSVKNPLIVSSKNTVLLSPTLFILLEDEEIFFIRFPCISYKAR